VISRDKLLSPNNDKEIADAKARANAHGEVIKVIIVSKVGTEGIDFKNIREVHILEPWFNLNRTEQIIGRAVRTCSHMDLPPEERNVTIYLHATTYSKDEESVDIKTYRICEKKQKNINEVQQVLKQNAIDCNLNLPNLVYKDLKLKLDIKTSQGNTIEGYNIGDRDYSHICDYGKCDAKCVSSVHDATVEDTTFDPLFIADDIDLYKKYIDKLFHNIPEYTYVDIRYILMEMYKNVEEDVLSYALPEMIDSQYKFKDKHGQYGYIIYRGNKYIYQLAKQYETKLSLEEREDVVKRNVLDFDILRLNNISNSTSNTKKNEEKTSQDIYKKLKKNFAVLENIVKTYTLDVPQKILIESIIDRLSLEELSYILLEADHADDPGIYDALVNSNIVVKEGDVPKYFYHTPTDTFFVINKERKSVKEVGPLERAKISKAIEKVYANVSYDNEEYRGLLDVNKKNEANFKIRDNARSKGFVCHQTSSLSVEALRKKLNEIAPGTISENVKISKKTLCDIYELILRSHGPGVFKRPFDRSKN